DKVIGGSINGAGLLTVKVSSAAGSGFLASVNKLVQSSQMAKSQLQNLADRVSGWLFYAALVVGIIALIDWTAASGIAGGLKRMVTVLVIACPHALGLAIPLVNAKSTALGARHGLLIRNRNVISASPKINYLLLDKTGTLTAGKFQVRGCASLDNTVSDEAVLGLIATLEQDSTHPIAQCILQYAREKRVAFLPISAAKNLAGQGVAGTIGGQSYQLVSERAARAQVADFPHVETQGYTVSYLLRGAHVLGYVEVGDQVKSSAAALVKQIKQRNITPVMLTGDNKSVAHRIAEEVGITDVYAELMPQDKEKIVAKLRNAGNKVMMVGDGINDAPSLA
ncbi:HAD family hydrolase, partial [Lactobacillus sp. XV13L]|nr:HAD family hydrolase [Lactobacillus sp. XV13L]